MKLPWVLMVMSGLSVIFVSRLAMAGISMAFGRGIPAGKFFSVLKAASTKHSPYYIYF